ncbi:alginate lyase family protein [Runella sp.]|uniref:alginate lyase family protein n=1 Tax=Runella sp. TaxID=1960881 RepID=UPI003D0DFEB0
MKIKISLLLSILSFLTIDIIAQKPWQKITTVEDVCENYPKPMQRLMSQLNLETKGLEQTREAYQKGDLVNACKALLAYYKNNGKAAFLRKTQPTASTKTVADADTILKDVFIVQNVRGKVMYGADGHRDWYYKGPNNDREWAWLSNRHSQVLEVFNAYFETGNPKYAQYIDGLLRDFIIKSMPYPAAKGSESIWRGLEVAARAKAWSKVFYGLINCEYLSPATQLLLLSSLPDHAHYNRNFHSGNNWLTMEISALATIATNFPEFKMSNEWLDYSIATMAESMKGQVYPDGAQTELTSHYHNVALANFVLFKDICDRANKPLPDFFNQTIENMYRYIAHAIRPDGFRILNNDGDLGSDRELVLEAAKKMNKNDWAYIASNGTVGTKPTDGPSYFYPWAGQLISRSGYDAKAHWSFFDIGPWGSGHQHNDKLHLSVSAYGRDLLVDAGRFAYTGETAEKFRPYAKGSEGHNLLLIDQHGQKPGPTLATSPLSDNYFKLHKDFDYASNSMSDFIDVEGKVEHTRSLFYVRDEFWVVVDQIKTDRPRQIDALWHWHPSCLVVRENSTVKTQNQSGNLAIMPVSSQKFDITFIKGQEKPAIQGWYSPEYNLYEPNSMSKYSAAINGNDTFVWLLLPSEKETPPVKAKILVQNEESVKLEVKMKGKTWQLTIPYVDSHAANLK